MNYVKQYLAETTAVVAGLDAAAIEKIVLLLADLRTRGGRLFFLGVGGSAARFSCYRDLRHNTGRHGPCR